MTSYFFQGGGTEGEGKGGVTSSGLEHMFLIQTVPTPVYFTKTVYINVADGTIHKSSDPA